MKIVSVLLCLCLVMSFAMPTMAFEMDSSNSFTVENEGETYDVSISYNAKGERVATVTGDGFVSTAVFSPITNTITLTETSLVTGETKKTTQIETLSEKFGTTSSSKLSGTVSSTNSIQESVYTKYFTIGYEVVPGAPYARWSIINTAGIFKIADATSANVNNLNNFKSSVQSCIAYENQFLAVVGSTISMNLLSILHNATGISAILAVLYALGIAEHPATIAANAWDAASRQADNADYYYTMVTSLSS